MIDRTPNVECTCQRDRYECRIDDRRQPKEWNPVFKVRTKHVAGFHGKPGLADSSRPNEREQPDCGFGEAFDDDRHLGISADQRRHREGQGPNAPGSIRV